MVMVAMVSVMVVAVVVVPVVAADGENLLVVVVFFVGVVAETHLEFLLFCFLRKVRSLVRFDDGRTDRGIWVTDLLVYSPVEVRGLI